MKKFLTILFAVFAILFPLLCAEAASAFTISAQPQPVTLAQGQTATFGVTAGPGTLTYQWQKDGVNLPGQTGTNLVLSNVQPKNIGYYTVAVTGSGTSVTSQQAALNISGEPFGIWQGLVAYYPFNGSATDASAFGNNGTPSNVVSCADRFGVANQAYRFNGSNSYVAYPDSVFGATTPGFTWSVWASPDSIQANRRIIDHGAVAGEALIGWDNNGNGFGLNLAGLGWQFAGFTTGTALRHIVCVYEKGVRAELWINGVLCSSFVPPNKNLYVLNGSVNYSSIGAFRDIAGAHNGFPGIIDDVKIYNRALSSAEVQQLFTAEGPSSPVITTGTSSGISSTGVTLSGTVNPSGYGTNVNFEYGTSTSYGKATALQDIGNGNTPVAVSANISTLSQNTTYHYRINTVTVNGTSSGPDQTFTTLADYSILSVSPFNGVTSTGNNGGPFTPSSATYTLTNSGVGTLNWQASNTLGWITLSSTCGTLSTGASTTVTASINSNANALSSGTYTNTLSFTNLTSGSGNTTRPLVLAVSFISAQPQPATLNQGQTATFGVTTSGSGTFTYQWQKDGVNLPGQTGTNLVLTNVQPKNIGYYTVVVTRSGTSVTSQQAALNISGVPFGIWQGMVAYYPFNGSATDASAFGNNGTAVNVANCADRFGVANQAYHLSGTNSYVRYPDSVFAATTPGFTWSLWVNPDNKVFGPWVMCHGAVAGEACIGWTGTSYQLGINSAASGWKNIAASSGMGLRHIVCVYQKGARAEIWIDGQLSSSFVPPNENLYVLNGFPNYSAIGATLGINGACLGFPGVVDDVKIYNRALSSTEVQQLFTAEGPSSPVITTGAPSGVSSTRVALSGTVNPSGYGTNVNFEYGTSTSYGKATSLQDIGNGSTPVAVSANISALSQNTTYHYRINTVTVNGTASGPDQTFTTNRGAEIVTPANGSTLAAASTTFTWTAVPGATQYALWIGSTPNSYDLFAGSTGANLSKTITLPTDGRPIYVRVYWTADDTWQEYNSYTYTASTADDPSIARMLTPSTGSTSANPSVTFSWTPIQGASQYALWIGSTPDSYDIFAGSVGTNLSKTQTLPVDGRTIYVRLWTMTNGTWDQYNSYTYKACTASDPSIAQMIAPTMGSAFTSSSVTFSWTSTQGASQYALWIGSTPDSHDIYAGSEGTNLSKTMTLPSDGRNIYVRLWTMTNGTWEQYNSYIYTACAPPIQAIAQMLTPANGSTFASSSVTFSWDQGSGVSEYALWIGSTPDSHDLYAGSTGTSLSKTLTLPVDGRTIYVRLWSMTNGTWDQYNSYTYKTATPPSPVLAQMLTPTAGSTFTSPSVTFSWDQGSGVSQYALWIGSTQGSYDLYAGSTGTGLSKTLTLPADGRTVYVRLWSMTNGTWDQYNSYTYTAYATPVPAKAKMTSPANGSVLTSSTVTLSWDRGTAVSQYALWVGSAENSYDLYSGHEGTNVSKTLTLPADGRPLFVRLWSMIDGKWEQYNSYVYTAYTGPDPRAKLVGITGGSPVATISWDSGTGVSQYALWVGSTMGGYDIYSGYENQNRSKTLTTIPNDGRPIYVNILSMLNGEWLSTSYVYNAATPDAGNVKAQITSPSNATLLTGSSVTLTWNEGRGATQYALWIGSTVDGHEIYAGSEGTNLSKTITLPTDGRPIYVRLWTMFNGVWEQYNSYYYVMPNGIAQMVSPTFGSTLTSAQTTFTWNAGVGASQYALWVGTEPGSYNIYAGSEGTNLSKTLTLPTDGNPIYVRLWSMYNGEWKQYYNYIYTAASGNGQQGSQGSSSSLNYSGATTVLGGILSMNCSQSAAGGSSFTLFKNGDIVASLPSADWLTTASGVLTIGNGTLGTVTGGTTANP